MMMGLVYINNDQAKVIKRKSVKYMPFWLSLTNFLWCVLDHICSYPPLRSLCSGNYFLTKLFLNEIIFCYPHFYLFMYSLLQISNSIGAVSGLVQFILYACYCCRGEDHDVTISEGPQDLEV